MEINHTLLRSGLRSGQGSIFFVFSQRSLCSCPIVLSLLPIILFAFGWLGGSAVAQTASGYIYASSLEWQVVLEVDQSWENGHVSFPRVIYDESLGIYRMWYSVGRPDAPYVKWTRGGVAHAESDDGIVWSNKEMQVPYSGTWDDEWGITPAAVLKAGGEYRLYIEQFFIVVGAEWSLYGTLRTAPDGYSWGPYSTIIGPAGMEAWELYHWAGHEAFPDPSGGYRLFYTVRFKWPSGTDPKVYRATAWSADGLSWGSRTQMIGDLGVPLFDAGIVFYDVNKQGIFQMFYPDTLGNIRVARSADGIHWSGIDHGYDDVGSLALALSNPPASVAGGGCLLRTPEGGMYIYFTVRDSLGTASIARATLQQPPTGVNDWSAMR